MKNNIPFDVAFALDAVTRFAWCVVFSEMEGAGDFNWRTMEFPERPR